MHENNRKPVIAAAVLLAFQPAIYYSISKDEIVPEIAPLATVSDDLGGWKKVQENAIEKEVADLLQASDTLSRSYVEPEGKKFASLFVAFFKTQRAGVSPHSPKVCLPGSGWVPVRDAIIPVTVDHRDEPIYVNRYTVSRGEHKSVVLYWYQTRDRVVANEYAAKLYLMLDSIRHRRSDTSLVRVVVPVLQDQSEDEAQQMAERFIRTFFEPLRRHLSAA